jgi:glycosyltransferase involved in cell wall biosynthesis
MRIRRIAHMLDAPFATREANGVAEAVRHLARAQADLGLSVAVFSGVDGPHVLGKESATASVASDVMAWRPDLLHFHSVHVARHVVAGARARHAGVAYCVTTHGGLCPPALQRGHFKKVVFNVVLERHFLRHASFVHALGPHEIPAIRNYGFDGPIVTVPNAVPPAEEPPPDRESAEASYPWLRGHRIFMFVGRLDPWQKGLDVLIEAFARADPGHGLLVLVGPDCRGSRATLERLREDHGIGSRVVFTGALFGEEKRQLFAAADVFVHPSRWEGLSLSVLSAAAAGKPCLITREADPLGSLERAGAAFLVEPTVPDLAAGIRRLATLAPSEMQAMGARARAAADAFPTWHEVARRLMNAYQSAFQEATTGRVAAGVR